MEEEDIFNILYKWKKMDRKHRRYLEGNLNWISIF